MASVTKQAKVVAIGEHGALPGPTDPATQLVTRVPTMTLTIVLGLGTSGEQRQTFMLLEADYVALGRPGYGADITVTLSA